MSSKPIIVIDPGHGGKEKVGGSSPNNAVGANGLLEKNLTLDMANRVAASLAKRADVFLTRAGDMNLGLSERAQIARDKNAAVFLSLHFNGFQDTNVDGTEVWVARKATQASRDFAQTLLSKVVSATQLKNRGVREGDLGVILPDRHAPKTSACLLEISFLTNPAQAKQLESNSYRQNIADSICEGLRQYLSLATTAQSFTYIGDFSMMLSAPTPDEVAQHIGYESHEDYVNKEVKSATLFGLKVDGGIRPDFYKKLQRAEDKAKKMIKPTPVTASDWGITTIRGYRGKEIGWHGWGLAVDIDYAKNPYIMHEAGEAELDKLLAPVYQRISWLMLKRDSVIPKSITAAGSAKVGDMYDKLLDESNAMSLYFRCMLDQKLIQKELDQHALSDANVWEAVWGIKNRKPSSDQMQEIMMRDYVTLAGEAGPSVPGKTYPDPKVVLKGTKVFEPRSKVDVPFDDKGKLSSRKPENGFLTIRKELVLALTDEGLRWGAMHFGGASGDVMHFDDAQKGSANPVVSKITAAKSALADKGTSKAKSYGDEDDYWHEQFDRDNERKRRALKNRRNAPREDREIFEQQRFAAARVGKASINQLQEILQLAVDRGRIAASGGQSHPSADDCRQWLVRYGLGIDCSGFVTQALNQTLSKVFGRALNQSETLDNSAASPDEERQERLDKYRADKQARAAKWDDEHGDTKGWYAGKQQKEQKEMKKKLAGTSTFEGEREDTLEGEAAYTLAPLSLGGAFLRVAGPKVAQFEDAFNLYRIPMQYTLEAIGRVQDIRSVGGPESPTEMNAKQKARFRPFTKKDHDQKQDYHRWQDEKAATQSSYTVQMGHASQLQGMQKKWQAAQYVLERQGKVKEKDKVQKKLSDLNADAEFVGTVVDLIKTVVSVGTKGPPEAGTVVTLIKLLGGAAGFERKIARLQVDIDGLNAKAEASDIAGTKQVLLGIIKEYEGGAKSVQDHKTSMRKNAALMADTRGDDEEGQNLRVVTLVAEAYQELRMFGEAAHKEAKQLKTLLPAVNDAVVKYKSQIRKYHDAERSQDYDSWAILNDKESQDAVSVNMAARAVVSYEKLLDKELPNWKAKEKAWSEFFAKNDV